MRHRSHRSDPAEPDRFWSVIRVTGTHTGEFNMGTAKVPPTGKKMVVGPQAYSVTFDANDKITRADRRLHC